MIHRLRESRWFYIMLSILLAVIGKKPLSEGANIGAAHTDAPRLDFKPNPLYEDAELAYIKTHHYGEAKSMSRSVQIPKTRSSSSTTCCPIWAASRAKSR